MSSTLGRAYGLVVQTELPLPELPPADAGATANLSIRFGAVAAPTDYPGESTALWTTPDDFCLVYRDAGAFQIRAGREIVIAPNPGVEERLLRLYLLGPALALVLHQRGWLVLHASAASLDGQVVGFLGGPQWGKSTMAATLHRRGHLLVADDYIAVATDQDPASALLVYPGFPQLKLWPEAAALTGADPDQLPQLRPDLAKRARRLDTGFADQPLPLTRLYVLDEGPTIAIEALDRQSALMELVRHSYAARALPQLDAAGHLRQCATVLRQVAVRRLRRPRNLAALDAVALGVETDAAEAPLAPKGQSMTQLEWIQPEGLARPIGYTQVVTAWPGQLVVISGQVAFDVNGQVVGLGDLGAQTRQVFENLRVALEAVGATFANVIKLTLFVVNYDPAQRGAIVAVRDEFVGRDRPPASTLVGVQALARPEFLIEIEALAVTD